jgi:hypothetical protein
MVMNSGFDVLRCEAMTVTTNPTRENFMKFVVAVVNIKTAAVEFEVR